MLYVDARSAYPVLTPSPRVRITSHAPLLRRESIDLGFSSSLTSEEYGAVTSSGMPVQKTVIAMRCAHRVACQDRSTDGLSMVHRLLSLIPVPGRDPARSVDIYDFDDALFVGSISAQNAAYR